MADHRRIPENIRQRTGHAPRRIHGHSGQERLRRIDCRYQDKGHQAAELAPCQSPSTRRPLGTHLQRQGGASAPPLPGNYGITVTVDSIDIAVHSQTASLIYCMSPKFVLHTGGAFLSAADHASIRRLPDASSVRNPYRVRDRRPAGVSVNFPSCGITELEADSYVGTQKPAPQIHRCYLDDRSADGHIIVCTGGGSEHSFFAVVSVCRSMSHLRPNCSIRGFDQ